MKKRPTFLRPVQWSGKSTVASTYCKHAVSVKPKSKG